MSEGAAYKRIRAARLARRCPVIFEMVADGRLHPSALVLLSTHLTPGNADELLSLATHRTKTETETLLARRFPQHDVPAFIRPLGAPSVPRPTEIQLSPGTVENAGNFVIPGSAGGSSAPVSDAAVTHGSSVTPPSPAAPTRVTPLAPERFALQVTLSQQTRDKLRRAQELLGHALPDGDIAQVLDRALEALITKLERQRCGATDAPRRRRRDAHGRHVSAELKRQVYARDGHQCVFVSEAGRRCEARSRLELDHITPLAKGGKTEISNLRLLCHAHNQLQAERVLGAGFMRRRRERAPA